MKKRAVLRFEHLIFERHKTAPPRHHEHLIEKLQQVEIVALARRALYRADGFLDDRLQRPAGTGNDENAQGDSSDGDEFRDMEQHQRIAPGDHESTERGGDYDNESDDEKHVLKRPAPASGPNLPLQPNRQIQRRALEVFSSDPKRHWRKARCPARCEKCRMIPSRLPGCPEPELAPTQAALRWRKARRPCTAWVWICEMRPSVSPSAAAISASRISSK